MKILTLNINDSIGGAAKAVYRLHGGLKSIQVDSNVLVKWKLLYEPNIFQAAPFGYSGMTKPLKEYVFNVKQKLQKNKWKKYPHREDAFMSGLLGVPLLKAISRFEFDILHLHWISHEYLDIHELTKLNKPIVWTLHDCWPFTGGCHYFYDCNKYTQQCGSCPMLRSDDEMDVTHDIWKQKQEIYSHCNLHIVSPSNWLADSAKASSLLKKFPVTVIPNGLKTDEFSPVPKDAARHALHLNQNKKYILFGAANATSDKRKGYHYLQEALTNLKSYSKDDVELLIFGNGNQREETLNGFRAHYLGNLYDDISVAAAYNAADVVIVPSLSENLSNVIMESMACGTPVVAFNIGGNSDMIDHQQNGYLAKALDAADLSEGIKWCMDNNKDNSLSENARKKVTDHYTIEKIAGKYKQLYESILKK